MTRQQQADAAEAAALERYLALKAAFGTSWGVPAPRRPRPRRG